MCVRPDERKASVEISLFSVQKYCGICSLSAGVEDMLGMLAGRMRANQSPQTPVDSQACGGIACER